MIEDPIEILVGMAQEGEIDPWNIDIIQITDRFFAELEQQQMLDLRVSGRTLFFAATLLRIKSELLDDSEDEESEAVGVWDDEGEWDTLEGANTRRSDPIHLLEHEIQRRLDRKNMRKQPITLYDLISILRNAEKEDRRRQRDGWIRDGLVFVDEIVGIAHEEAYHDSTELIFSHCEAGLSQKEVLTLSEVACGLGMPVKHVYIPLLFLMHEGRVFMRQDSFFGEIFIEKSSS